jgi:hypothetical protein
MAASTTLSVQDHSPKYRAPTLDKEELMATELLAAAVDCQVCERAVGEESAPTVSYTI